MKFIKKAAALFFCAALALSVMAVGALADDEAELLNTSKGATILKNSDFTVMLTKSNVDDNANIVSHDDVSGYEIDSNQQVTFDITVAYNYTDAKYPAPHADLSHYNFTGATIDAFQFTFKPERNYGATLVSAEVGNVTNSTYAKLDDMTHPNAATYFGGDDGEAVYKDTYVYSALADKSNDINLPAGGALEFAYNDSTETVAHGTKIGQITLEFTEATQAINIYPQIEDLLFLVRTGDTDSPQQLVAASFDSSNSGGTAYGSYDNHGPAGTNGSFTGGRDGNVNSSSIPDANDTVIVAPVPVIVNPIYAISLEEFHNDQYTGILTRTTKETTENEATVYVPKTTTVYYDYLTGSFQTKNESGKDVYEYNGTPTVLENGPKLVGYTLQGWMVTVDTDTSASWEAYSDKDASNTAFNTAWTDRDHSYPATTDSMYGQIQWAKTNQTSSLQDSWYFADDTDENDAGMVDFEVTTSGEGTNSEGHYPNTATSVNFIPVAKSGDTRYYYKDTAANKEYTRLPAGLIGNITLTPIYTRDVYTATFNANRQDDKYTVAQFNKDIFDLTKTSTYDASVSLVTENDYTSFTKQYTIEDLYDKTQWTKDYYTDTTTKAYSASNVYDFLNLEDGGTGAEAGPVGPWGVNQTAYKFMGWTVADADSNTNANYKWERDNDLSNPKDGKGDEFADVAAYNNARVLKTANCKHIGNVTFTACWEEDIYYAEIPYWYAGSAHVLVLVAVPSKGIVASSNTAANYSADYTYYLNPNSNDSKQKMFIVPEQDLKEGKEPGQRAAYVAAAIAEALVNEDSNDDYTSLEKFTADISHTSANDYVLFAYIAKPGDVDQSKVTIDEANTTDSTENSITGKCANRELKYDGDVDGSTGVNVGDFGNVDTLFDNPNDTDISDKNIKNTANVFKVDGSDGYYGVLARLQADVVPEDATDKGDGKTEGELTSDENIARMFASIKDIKFIYDQMGYDKSDS